MTPRHLSVSLLCLTLLSLDASAGRRRRPSPAARTRSGRSLTEAHRLKKAAWEVIKKHGLKIDRVVVRSAPYTTVFGDRVLLVARGKGQAKVFGDGSIVVASGLGYARGQDVTALAIGTAAADGTSARAMSLDASATATGDGSQSTSKAARRNPAPWLRPPVVPALELTAVPAALRELGTLIGRRR